MNRQLYRIWLLIIILIPSSLFGLVGQIEPGQTLWYIACKIAGTSDIIESKVCLIDSQLDVVESKIDEVATSQEFFSIGDILCSKMEALDQSVIALQASGLDQFEELLCSKIDMLIADTESIDDKIDNMLLCNPTPITGPTTITTEGVYCVANPIDGSIEVQASNVVINNDGYRIFNGGMIIDNSVHQVTFDGGVVEGSGAGTNGIEVRSGTMDITINDMVVKDSGVGISMEGVLGGVVSNCELTANTTGMQLCNTAKITVDKTIAECNTNAGFCLLSSTTNVFTDCKALSTGEGNTELSGAVIAGFVSTDGFGNIFERCIANSTQGLTVTGANSLIAGFALRGNESCSKIIDSESANSTSSETGVTIPYGILLEATLNNPITQTTSATGPTMLVDPDVANWSPDGKYIVVVDPGTGADNVIIYQFDYLARTLIEVAAVSTFVDIQSADWSPNGNYVVVVDGGSNDIVSIYQFDPIAGTLIEVTTSSGPTTLSGPIFADWSPDGKYIAVVDGGVDLVIIYQFDPIAGTLIELTTSSGPTALDAPFSGRWSPDGNYIVVVNNSGGTPNVIIYRFNRTSLIEVTTDDGSITLSNPIFADWSPDGKYVALANLTGAVGEKVVIYRFDRTTEALTVVTTESSTPAIGLCTHVRWSSDGTYLAAAAATDAKLLIYKFDPGDETLVVAADSSGVINNNRWVDWSPDGRYVAIADQADVIVYDTLTFPSKNVIKNNTVYCNSGGSCPSGVGISGSSIQNMIIGNTAYSNPVPQMTEGGGPIVESNYYFVTNVFNELFGNAPTDLQNISVGGCEPICTPEDLALLLKQIKNKVCNIQSQEEVILSKIEAGINECEPTNILSSTTITIEGVYCVANQIVDGPIEIATSNVVVEINGYRLEDGVVINGGLHEITLRNGVVEGTSSSDAIKVNGGTTDVTLENITTKNAIVGINMENVTGATITNCSLTQNTTGMELCNSHKIVVDNTIASCNVNAGFCLLTSTTCVFTDCKALSTGEGNNEKVDQTVFGFVSTDGFGNIFERCIANSTQALSTTDYNSVVAGFAFRGDEKCSKIIDSESANAQTDPIGVTVPYGILLEARFDGLVTATVHNPGGGGTGDDVLSVNWSPDGKYLAVGGTISGGGNEDLFVYRFDRMSETLLQVDAVNPGDGGLGDTIESLNWSPDGKYLAVGGTINTSVGEDLFVYRFDRVSETLTQVDVVNPGGGGLGDTVYSVNWSPDGKYLAVGGTINTSVGEDLFVYRFDRVSETLLQVDAVNPGGGDLGDFVYSVNWSPDGRYLAVGGTINTSVGEDLFVYRFDRGSETLLQVDAVNPGGSGLGDTVRSLNWSSDGKYLAVGGNIYGDEELFVYRFDRVSETLTQVDAVNLAGAVDTVLSLNWSPDGRYLAVGGIIYGGVDEDLFVYRFDRGSETLLQVDVVDLGGGIGDSVNSVNWSPDGRYLAVGGDISGGGEEDLVVYCALTFPSKNVIKDNVVYCNSGGSFPSGVGISGSSIQNMIIGNTAYSNPIPQTNVEGGGPIVESNYYFVTNVFNELFGQAPSDMQNISVGGCEPICTPDDLALLAKQIKAKVCHIQSQQDVIESKLDLNLDPCAPMAITGPTVITTEGVYCVGNMITGDIEVATSNVTILNSGYRIVGSMIVDSGVHQVTFDGGVVEGSGAGTNGIEVRGGTSQIKIEDVTVKDAGVGINFENVTGGTITNCTLTSNTTGLELCNSHKIIVENSTAACNTNAGFCLLTSTTCFFGDCKALSNGEGNTQISGQTIFGFVSTDGFGNIFERCIANGTQGLQVADFDSIVAGFAFRGSEKCSKIIDSESSNAQASEAGVTMPYGILLESTLGSQITLTAIPPVPQPGDDVLSLAWSPGECYLVVGTASGDSAKVRVYEVDTVNKILAQVAADVTPSGDVNSVAWSLDLQHVVAGSSNGDIHVYHFESANNTLTQFATAATALGSVLSVAWSNDGRFVAVTGTSGTRIEIYEFNRIHETLTQVATPTSPGVVVNSVDWSPDGEFVVAGLGDSTVRLYSFSASPGILLQVDSDTVNGIVNSVSWSSDGIFVAAGDAGSVVNIFEFDPSAQTLTARDTDTVAGSVTAVNWSADSRNVVAAFEGGTNINVYEFDRSGATTLELKATPDFSFTTTDVQWSPDGQFIAAGTVGASNSLLLYEALTFPSKNIIKNNTVYCNSGAQYPSGVGISGSSIVNMIIQNTAYSNPIPQTSLEGGGPIVFSNYVFVTNVFNQLFGQAPTDLQNISLGGCEPICTPDDLALLVKQSTNKMCVIDSKIGDLSDNSSCFPTLIDTPSAINNTELTVVSWLKSILSEIRGCNVNC